MTASPTFYCPNCAQEMARDAVKCPGCAADFGPSSQWRPLPVRPDIAEPLSFPGVFMKSVGYVTVMGFGAAYGVAMYQLFANVFTGRTVNGLMLVSFLAGIPMSIGVIVGFAAGRRRLAGVTGAGALSTLSICLFVFAAGAVLREGFICIVMALPIFFVMGLVGALIGALMSSGKRKGTKALPVILLVPILGGPAEALLPSDTVHLDTTRSIHIAATPEKVWQQINYPLDIKPNELAEGFAYRIGVPYPIEARTIEGRVGGTRFLSWERGVTFEETITAWEPNRHIAWVYKFGPDSFPPGSLDDHIVIGGQYFDLEATSYTLREERGGTRLTIAVRTRVTTHFNWYAGLWADYLVDDTAGAILNFYKTRAESMNPG